MMKMRRFGSIALAVLTFGAMGLTPAEAAYKPKVAGKMGGQFTKEVKKAVTTLKSMAKTVRWTFYAEKLGLCFMPPNGALGYEEWGNMRSGSHFIGSDGMEYDAKAEFQTISWEKDGWKFCADSIERLSQEAVFSKLSSEVTALVLENAKYHLEKMAEEQPERRDMYLAFLAKLCYLPDGNSPYEKLLTKTGAHKNPYQYYELGGKGCLFVDTEGTEHKFDDVNRKYDSLKGARWTLLNICAHHVGAKDILALFPDEVKKLRANYRKKMQELEAGATEPNEDKADEETSEPSEKAESLAAKLGVTYQSKMNTDRMGGQFKKDLDSVLEYLKSLPTTIRWCFIAERMGLMFMPQDGGFGHNKEGWIRAGSHFIGADGLEYDARSEADAQQTGAAWGVNTSLTDRLGRNLVFSQLPDEVADLVLQNAKYQLDKLAEEYPEAREAILARIAQLEYRPDGKSPYILKPWKWGRVNVVNEYVLSNSTVYHYVDTEGKVQCTGDVYDKMNKGRWAILIICAHHLGKDAILALCPDVVKKLRDNYEKKMQELSAGATEPKEDKADEPSEKAESLAAKLGVTYCPKTDADRMSGQFKSDMQSVQEYLDSLPKSQRWFFITERLGLLFTLRNGGSGAYSNAGWYKAGARFIGANGLIYDVLAELNAIEKNGARSEWNKYTGITERLGREVIFSQFPEEVAELVLQNAKYQLEKMADEQPERRELYLAYLAQLCYLPDGSSPYDKMVTKRDPHRTPIQYYELGGKGCLFVDTEGTEHKFDDVNEKYASLGDARWMILNDCSHHLGTDAILALCPDVVKKLRDNYEKKMQELKE